MRLVCTGLLLMAPLVSLALPAPQAGRPSAPQLTAIQIEPQPIRLDRPGATQQILVIGKYADGTLRDVTDQAQFSSSSPQIAGVSKTGRLTRTS